MPADLTTADADAGEALLTWWASAARELPWRTTRDPWTVLVSELMLQQTQVARVVPKFHAFVGRFPTLPSCAAAPLSDVVRLWAGLGYNRRAVNLHTAARACVEHHGGALPDDLDTLLALPGIGPYTARAVLAFAFGRDVGVRDVNARRVLARAFAADDQRTADAVVPIGTGWSWNQAMLDLGATVCTRNDPNCDACPLASACRWHNAGRVAPDPAPPPGRQSRFAGSDRQGRGRLVDALRHGAVQSEDLARVMGWPDDPERAARLAATLVADHLARRSTDGTYHLP